MKKKNDDIDKALGFMGEFMEEPLYPTGMKEAVVGYVERFGMSPVILLDREKCIEILMRDMNREEAEEYFEFNTIGGWLGEGTPAFATLNKDILKLL